MKIKKTLSKKILIPVGIITLFIIFLAFRLIQYQSIKTRLPLLPETAVLHTSLREQIGGSNRMVYRHPAADNIGMLGMVYHSGAFYDEAAICYQIAIEKNRKKWIWNYYLGILNNEFGDSEKAKDCFSEVIRKNPKAWMAWYYKGEAFFNLNNTDSAGIIFRKIAGLKDPVLNTGKTTRENSFPLQVYARYQLARILMLTNRTDQAEKELQEIIDRYIAFGPAYRQLEVLYAGRGDSALARHFASRANDLVFYYTSPPDTLVDKLALTSRSDTYLTKFIDVAIRSNNLIWAITLLDHGLKYLPDNQEYISRMVHYSLKVGLGPKALPLLDRNLKYIGNDLGELKEVGFLLSNSGLQIKAMDYFKQAAKLTNEKPESLADIIVWLYNNGAIQECDSLINKLMVRYPDDQVIPSIVSSMYLFAGDNEKALYYFEKLKSISPGGPRTLTLMGLFAEKEGNTTEALRYYEQSYLLNPKDRFLLNKLYEIYYNEKKWIKTKKILEDAVILYPNNSEFQTKLGELLVTCPETKLRDIEKGREYLERAYYNMTYLIPSHITAGKNLSLAWQMTGDNNKALYYINETINYAKLADAPIELLTELFNQAKSISTVN